MGSIFDIGERYRESHAAEYTRKHLIEVLNLSKGEEDSSESDYEYRAAEKICGELCPITFGKEEPSEEENPPFSIGRKERDEISQLVNPMIKNEQGNGESSTGDSKNKRAFGRLQFLHYMIMKNRECKKKGFSVFDCIGHPSQRHCPMYTEMIGEIQDMVSDQARVATVGLCTSRTESTLPDNGLYDDSIHALQQLCDLISTTLIFAYGYSYDTLKILENRERLFHEKIRCFAKQNSQRTLITSYWDELYFRLHYARCLYWEWDLLWAYQEVQKIALKSPENLKYPNMRKEVCRKLVDEDYCLLVLNDETNQIEESQESRSYEEGTVPDVVDVDLYVNALARYIENHTYEIAEKTFCIQKVTKAEEKKIWKRIPKVCEYIKIEFRRYGRSSGFTKAKLISAYQVFFLSLPGSGIALKKVGTAKAQTPSGLLREKDTISASYSNSNEKEPLYLQMICTWTDYQYLWNTQDSLFARKYLEISISALEAILSAGYHISMANIQLRAETVLLTAMETLIPDEKGIEELENCVRELSKPERQIIVENSSMKTFIMFGKFCKLVGSTKISTVIGEKLDAEKRRPMYLIFLDEATDTAFHMHKPMLKIKYNINADIYVLYDFKVENLGPFFIMNDL